MWRRPTPLILAVLDDGPGHGYAISQELAARSGGVLSYPTGSLYPALRRLEKAGLITGAWRGETGRQRRTYELTPAGRRVLNADKADWQQFTSAVDSVLRRRPSTAD